MIGGNDGHSPDTLTSQKRGEIIYDLWRRSYHGARNPIDVGRGLPTRRFGPHRSRSNKAPQSEDPAPQYRLRFSANCTGPELTLNFRFGSAVISFGVPT